MESYPLRIKFASHSSAEKALDFPSEKGVLLSRPNYLSSAIWMIVSGKNSDDAYAKADKFIEVHRKEIEHILVPSVPNLKTKK